MESFPKTVDSFQLSTIATNVSKSSANGVLVYSGNAQSFQVTILQNTPELLHLLFQDVSVIQL